MVPLGTYRYAVTMVILSFSLDGRWLAQADDSGRGRPGLLPPCGPCPAHLNQGAVCGSDGLTYQSHCRLRHTSCQQLNQRGQTGLRVAHTGACPPDSYQDFRDRSALCGLPCPPTKVYVCGDDGRTYRSKCHLRQAGCREKRLIRVASKGPCRRGELGINPPGGTVAGTLGGNYGGTGRGRGKPLEIEDESEEDDSTEREDGDGDDEDDDDYDDDDGDDDSEEDNNDVNPTYPAPNPPTMTSSGLTSRFTARPPLTTMAFPPFPGVPEATVPPIPNTPESTPRTTVPCPTSCPLETSYVCGTNGQTYNSECLLRSAACQAGDPGIQVAYIGPCIEPPHFPFFEDQNPALPRPEPTIVAEPTEAPRPVTAAMPDRPQRQSYCPSEDECSLLYLPVCGSDGVTYLSWCHLRVVACGNKVVVDSLSVVHMGECLEQGDNGCDESCSDQFDPVCGSDGMTYYSECNMGRIACLRDESKPEVRHQGSCDHQPLDCPESCPGINDPVCGTDGNSYPSLCLITMASCQSNIIDGQELQTAYRGLCVNEPCQKSCPTRSYTPLCGSNGQTYQNECFLWLDMCRHPQLVRFDENCNLAIP
ncbi:agrin-like [Asterias rubens]|uniref:agrin-like n=1 Tax=Asterias rubens TaxID=7604 RepID=UPI0014552E34|nr:agrin-like [Asterias rubens]XP_033647455.1 agrin-like [Asterias rubens]